MPTTTIRYDESVRDKVVPMLDQIGLSLNSYLNLALNQLAIQGRVPFEIYATRQAPVHVQIVGGSSPRAYKKDGHLVFPADWYEDDDE